MDQLLRKSNEIIEELGLSINEKLLKICELIQSCKASYSWVGIYFMNDQSHTLHLGPFIGKPTDHVVIPYGKGICGQVATSGNTYHAENVAEEDNYIACSLDVQSELVIPIYDDESLVAQLDIDSSSLEAFSIEEKEILEALCYSLGAQLGPEMHLTELQA